MKRSVQWKRTPPKIAITSFANFPLVTHVGANHQSRSKAEGGTRFVSVEHSRPIARGAENLRTWRFRKSLSAPGTEAGMKCQKSDVPRARERGKVPQGGSPDRRQNHPNGPGVGGSRPSL